MSLLSTQLATGNLNGTVYTFEEVGDVLPMHNHDEMTAHLTIVARGRIKAHGDDWSAEFGAGSVIDFQANQSHEFIALEENSRIVNIIK